MKVSVIGLGKAGLPLATVIADSGINVTGIDINSKRCELINSGTNPIKEEPGLQELIKKHGGKNLFATSEYNNAKDCGIFIVIVPLFLDKNNNADFSLLKSVFINIGHILKKGDIIVLETSVPPMTTETVVRNWLEEVSNLKLGDFYLANSPERIMTGLSISRLQEFPKVIGGVDKESGQKAYDVYKLFIPNLHLVSSAKVAEFIKIIEGCYRDNNIALANELYKISNELGLDFFEARKWANHDYCDIHLPSTGAGGHCIPLYPWFLIKEMEKKGKNFNVKLLRTSREINDEMIEFWAKKIIQEGDKLKKPNSKVKVCINGISYRKGVKEVHHSRNLALTKLLADKGVDVFVYDELFTKDEVLKLGLKWGNPEEADLLFEPFKLVLRVSNHDS